MISQVECYTSQLASKRKWFEFFEKKIYKELDSKKAYIHEPTNIT